MSISQQPFYLSIQSFAKGRRGFTLIELMVVVAVVGILAAIAYPSYLSQVRKSRRSDAVQALAQVQQAQERFRANNVTYTSTLSSLGISSSTSSGTYYTVSTATVTGSQTCPVTLAVVACTTGTCYSATATAVSGTSQASDTNCTALVTTWLGPCGTITSTPTACWSK